MSTEQNNPAAPVSFKRSPWYRQTIWLIGVFTLIRICIAHSLELSPDEAYYWTWSQRLDASYFDHPPAIAWLIRSSTSIFGNTQIGVRMVAISLNAMTTWCIFLLASALFHDERAGWGSALLANVIPLMSVGAMLVTPDTPQAFAWALSMLFFWRALTHHTKRWWIFGGFSLGFGLLSKYTALLFLPCALIWLLIDRRDRHFLRSPWPFLTSSIALLVFLPVLIWNHQHEWISFTFQMQHAFRVKRGGWHTLLELIAVQIGLITPLLFALLVYCMLLCLKTRTSYSATWHRAQRFLLCFYAPIYIVIAISALRRHTEANWPSSAYIAISIALGGLWSIVHQQQNIANMRLKTAWISGTALAAVLTLFIHAYALHPFADNLYDVIRNRFHGWRQATASVKALTKDIPSNVQKLYFVDSYQLASELAFYGIPLKNIGMNPYRHHRTSQFDLWTQSTLRKHDAAVYIMTQRSQVPTSMRKQFTHIDPPIFVPRRGLDRHNKKRIFTIIKAHGFKAQKNIL